MSVTTPPVGPAQVAQPQPEVDLVRRAALRFGVIAAVVTTVLTVVSFGLALTALPDKVPYPFTDDVIAAQWPGDYLWMYPAVLLMLIVVVLFVSFHRSVPEHARVYSQTAFAFVLLGAGLIATDYYIQIAVLQPSTLRGETDGVALLTQFNAHGVFIALDIPFKLADTHAR